MPALTCLTDSASVSTSARHRFVLPGAAVLLAAVLSACAPLSTSTDGAIATSTTSDGAVAPVSASAKLAKAAPAVPRFKDPMQDLKADLEDQEPLPEVDQLGIASWYGPGFHGRKTANGERFNQYDLTAAHPKFAFGTQLCVRNAANGKTVMVRVNDRGPFVKNRVIDLSKAAAEEIGMLGKGVKKVEIYKLQPDDEDCPQALQESILEARN